MNKIIAPKTCDCGMPCAVLAALKTASFEVLARAVKMCADRQELCTLRIALLKSLHAD